MRTILAFVFAFAADAVLLLVLNTKGMSDNTMSLIAVVGFVAFYFLAALVVTGGIKPSPAQKLRREVIEIQKQNYKRGGTYYEGMDCPHCGAKLLGGWVDARLAQYGWVNMDGFDKQAMKEGVLKCTKCGTLLRL